LFRYFGEAALSTDASLPSVPDETEAHRALIREAIQATAEQGNAVIVAHAASLTLGPRNDVLRVLVTASPETRAKRMADHGSEREAHDLIRKSDAGRSAYLRSFYGIAQELPTHYDLVLNTDVVTVEQASALVAVAATAADS
jgi:cytidylate kinase